MKILSVGNSFSTDAQRWLHDIALCGGDNIDTYNLYIGGCSLETHCDCIKNRKADYVFEGNANRFIKETSANEVIENGLFDIITVQQASGYSGRPQSYIPYLTKVMEYIKENQPEAKVYFHQTWSYEIGSDHGHFAFYNNDQNEMHRRISDCAEMAKRIAGIDILPVGGFINYLRENTGEFNYRQGGLSLCRDGFHLSEDYGRFAAAAVWYKELCGKFADAEKFYDKNGEFDLNLLNVIIKSLKDFYEQRD